MAAEVGVFFPSGCGLGCGFQCHVTGIGAHSTTILLLQLYWNFPYNNVMVSICYHVAVLKHSKVRHDEES